jgi:hypothetical protein
MNINLELLEKEVNKKSNFINNDTTSDKESVICLYDFFCSNNIKICEKIKEHYYLTDNYYIINEFSTISISEITDKNIYLKKTSNENNKYVLLQYNKVKYLDFYNFLFNLSNLKLFIFHVLDSYQFLLNSLLKLQEINICFFNLSVKNIIFTKKYKPILQNFSTSLMLNKCDDIDYFSKIIDKIEDYVYKPIEIHVIFYLIKNNEDSLSFYAIDSICNNFIQNMEILSLFSQNFKDNYYKTSINCLKKYINKPKKEIITEILKYSNTWDNYELSILYLHIIGNISRTFSLKDTFINKLAIILEKNISSEPLSRDTLLSSINTLDKLFYEYTNWEYINSIPNEKMNILYDILLK